MSKHMRKLIVFTVVTTMIFSMLGAVFAGHNTGSEFSDVDASSEVASDFNLLAELGVFEGYPDGTVGPDETLTRAEFAAVAVRAAGSSSAASRLSNIEPDYADDIPQWAWGWVNAADAYGFVQGYPDDTFRPNAEITFAEAVTVLVRILGYGPFVPGDSWPLNYIAQATDLDLDDGIGDIPAELPILRSEMAMMTANALRTETANANGNPSGMLLVADSFPDFDASHLDVGDRVAGTYDSTLQSSNRIELADGTRFGYDDNTDVFLNGADQNVADANAIDAFAFAGTDITAQLNSDGVAVSIMATIDTLSNANLSAVTTESGETDFGTVTVAGDVYDVSDETTVLLNGQAVTQAELESAFNAFNDDFGTDALATIRTEGNMGTNLTHLSVITDNTITGEVTALGNDGDAYARVIPEGEDDSVKVYYSGFTPTVGNTQMYLLGSDDVARIVLDSGAPGTPDEFWAHVLGYETDGSGNVVNITVHTESMTDPVTQTVAGEVYNGDYVEPIGNVDVNEVAALRVSGGEMVDLDQSGAFDADLSSDSTINSVSQLSGSTYVINTGVGDVYVDANAVIILQATVSNGHSDLTMADLEGNPGDINTVYLWNDGTNDHVQVIRLNVDQ